MKLLKKKALKKLDYIALKKYKVKARSKFDKYIYKIDSLLAKPIKNKVSKKKREITQVG